MADAIVYGLAEDGEYLTTSPNPHIDLDGTVPSTVAIGKLLVDGLSNGDTVTVTVRKDSSNWKVYSGATFTTGTPNLLDFSAATLKGSEGAISSTDSVEVYVLAPDSSEVSAPATSTSPGVPGQWAWSSPYYFKCYEANKWLRFIPESVWT